MAGSLFLCIFFLTPIRIFFISSFLIVPRFLCYCNIFSFILKNMFELKEFPLYAGALQRESSFAHLSVSFIQFSLKTRRNPSRPFRLTGMRIEEILGLRWEDIDTERDCIHIRRAVVHPGRSAPEVKTTKNGKERVIPIPQGLLAQLSPRERTGFILNSYCDLKRERPLSYTEYRRSFDRIRKLCGIEDYSAHDFRDTCATEWRESGISIDMIARLLGHQKTDVTEQRYVKYRPELYKQAQEKMSVYGTSNGTKRER